MTKHSHILKTALFLIACLSTTFQAKADINFSTGSLDKVKKDAAAEGKLYFVDFTAAWCAPCRIMDEYTFTDPSLGYYVRKNYLAAKVDIDNFDGVGYKQQYNITSLPSVLVFNSSGRLVGRYEESLSASKMLEILKKHDIPSNRKKVASAPKAKPKPAPNYSRPSSKPTATPKPKAKPAAPAKPAPTGNGLYRFDVRDQESKGFSVQIGVYADYENVLREVSKFKRLFSEPILVHIDKLTNKTVYRVMVGEFGSMGQAERFTGQVKQKGLDGFARNLEGLK